MKGTEKGTTKHAGGANSPAARDLSTLTVALDELRMSTTEIPALQPGGQADLMRLVNRLLGTVDADTRARTLIDIIDIVASVEDAGVRQGLAFFTRFQALLYTDHGLEAVTSLAAPSGLVRSQ